TSSPGSKRDYSRFRLSNLDRGLTFRIPRKLEGLGSFPGRYPLPNKCKVLLAYCITGVARHKFRVELATRSRRAHQLLWIERQSSVGNVDPSVSMEPAVFLYRLGIFRKQSV